MNKIKLIKPDAFVDFRGELWTVWNNNWDTDCPIPFVHSKFSKSKKNVLRGLHGDSKTWKLVSCIEGEIYMVVVNRSLSWKSWILSEENKNVLIIPASYALGHLVISEKATLFYQLAYEGEYFDTDNQFTIKWNDPEIRIDWGIKNPILSERDKNGSYARDVDFGI